MSLAQSLSTEFDREMATTRRLLERVPDDRLAWQPHAKSMTLGRLASHLADLPGRGSDILGKESLDVARPGGPAPAETQSPKLQSGQNVQSGAEILERFDRNVAAAREALAAASDEAFRQPWTLSSGGREILTLPRAAMLRTILFSHMIHHRGQLSVYLRLNDIPVPPIYGPSADESPF
ncbi:MAG: DinB family protein [Acidobacteriota bacterium]|nr:DinB family protein [Acidobacteriota bacterium]